MFLSHRIADVIAICHLNSFLLFPIHASHPSGTSNRRFPALTCRPWFRCWRFYWMPRNLQTDDSGWFRSHDIWSPAITTAFLISLLMFRRTLHLQENHAMPSMSPMKLHSLVSFCILVPAHDDGLHMHPTTKAFNKHEVATQRFTANLPLIPDLLSIHPLGSFTLKTTDIHLCTIGNFTFWHLLYQLQVPSWSCESFSDLYGLCQHVYLFQVLLLLLNFFLAHGGIHQVFLFQLHDLGMG